jgi:hypothetical protein
VLHQLVLATLLQVPQYALRLLVTPVLQAIPTKLAQLALATVILLPRRYSLVRFDPPFDYFLI